MNSDTKKQQRKNETKKTTNDHCKTTHKLKHIKTHNKPDIFRNRPDSFLQWILPGSCISYHYAIFNKYKSETRFDLEQARSQRAPGGGRRPLGLCSPPSELSSLEKIVCFDPRVSLLSTNILWNVVTTTYRVTIIIHVHMYMYITACTVVQAVV